MTGFGHGTVLGVADQVIDAVKNGDIRHFFLVGGCDGARPGRNYYTEFVKQTPKDTVILTLACGKYRFNDLDLGEIGGLPASWTWDNATMPTLPFRLLSHWQRHSTVMSMNFLCRWFCPGTSKKLSAFC